MKLILAVGVLLLVCSAPLRADNGPAADASVAFPQVTGDPIPVHSASGRFSSLDPPNQLECSNREVSGRVIAPSLIMVKRLACGRPGHDNLLVNVELSNPADTAQMVTGRHVAITAKFISALEDRVPTFVAEFLIAEKAKLVAGDPIDRSAPPAKPFTSYMMCQPPELDTLATQLGRELCVQSTIVADLAVTDPALEAAARAPQKVSPDDSVLGSADAISCRFDPGVSDRHLSAIACARNNYWAWYKAKWKDPLSSIPAPP